MGVHDDLAWLARRARPAARRRSAPACPCSASASGPSSSAAALGAAGDAGPGARVRRRRGPPDDGGDRAIRCSGPPRPRCPACTGTATPSPCPRARCGWPATTPTRTRPSASATGPTACSSTSRSTASLVAHWGRTCPPGVFVRASDVAHVSRAGDGIVRRFVALAGSVGRRAGRRWRAAAGCGVSPPSGAARTGGSRRGGSTRPPSACRCARSPGTR